MERVTKADGAAGRSPQGHLSGTGGVVVVGLDQVSCDSLGRVLVEEGCATHVLSIVDPDGTRDPPAASEADLVLVNESIGKPFALDWVRRSARSGHLVIAFGAESSPGLVLQMVEAGAVAVVERTASLREIVGSVRRVRAGCSSFGPEVAFSMAQRLAELSSLCRRVGRDPERLERLTPREREVLGLVGEDASNREIAERLYISVGTVKSHMHRVLRKLEVRSREDAAEFLKIRTPDPHEDVGGNGRPTDENGGASVGWGLQVVRELTVT